jgi:hypothetical protein
MALLLGAACLLGVLAAGPSAPALAGSAPFEYYPGLPQGTVGVSTPTIADELVLTGASPGQLTFTMTLNGTAVPAELDPDGSRISYTPPAPLAPGTYNVALHIAVGQWYADSDWRFQVAPNAVATLPGPGPASLFALAWVNHYRALAGLPALAAAPALVAAAAAHALSVHDETAGWPGFTGLGPADRAGYFGFGYGGITEDMAFGSGIAGAVDGWMDSVYHRFAITDPMARYAGFAVAGQGGGADPNQPVTDLEVADAGSGPSDPTTAVVYPAAGQQGLPEAFPAGEVPDPLTAFAGGTYPAGYPITLDFGSPNAASVTVTSAALTNAAGAPVPFDLLDGATTPPNAGGSLAVSEMGTDVALIPVHPLQPATLYHVQVAGTVTDNAGAVHPFSRTWSFSTSAYVDPGNLSAADDGNGNITLTTTGDTSHASVFLGGFPVPGLVHVNANTMTFTIPAGLGGSADLYVVQPDGQEESWPAFVGPGGGWSSPAGTPPASPSGGILHVGGTSLMPLGVLAPLGVQASTVAPTGMTILQAASGQVLGAFRPGDPVGYLAAPGTGQIQRVVFANPPVRQGSTVYIPDALAAAAGYTGTAVSYAPAGYTGPQSVTLAIGLPQYTADGTAAAWSVDLGAPFIAPGGRTMLPLRALAYVFGLRDSEITWFGPGGLPETGPVQEIDLHTPWGATVRVTPTQILRTGPGASPPLAIPLDTAGFLVINGRTFVPFRALGYAFGLDANQISWTADPATGAVTSVSFSWQAAP